MAMIKVSIKRLGFIKVDYLIRDRISIALDTKRKILYFLYSVLMRLCGKWNYGKPSGSLHFYLAIALDVDVDLQR